MIQSNIAATPEARELQWLETLVARHLVNGEALQHFRELHRSTGQPIPVLLQEDPVSEHPQIGQAIGEYFGVPWLSLHGAAIDPDALR